MTGEGREEKQGQLVVMVSGHTRTERDVGCGERLSEGVDSPGARRGLGGVDDAP